MDWQHVFRKGDWGLIWSLSLQTMKVGKVGLMVALEEISVGHQIIWNHALGNINTEYHGNLALNQSWTDK